MGHIFTIFDGARTVSDDTAESIAEWCNGKAVHEYDAIDQTIVSYGVNVPCGDEVKRASKGDVVIKYHGGNFDVVRASGAEKIWSAS